MHGVEYGYSPVQHFRVRASRTVTEGCGSLLDMVCEIVLWWNSDNTTCQAPEVHTWYILVHTWYIPSMVASVSETNRDLAVTQFSKNCLAYNILEFETL